MSLGPLVIHHEHETGYGLPEALSAFHVMEMKWPTMTVPCEIGGYATFVQMDCAVVLGCSGCGAEHCIGCTGREGTTDLRVLLLDQGKVYCRECLPGVDERYRQTSWAQVLEMAIPWSDSMCKEFLRGSGYAERVMSRPD